MILSDGQMVECGANSVLMKFCGCVAGDHTCRDGSSSDGNTSGCTFLVEATGGMPTNWSRRMSRSDEFLHTLPDASGQAWGHLNQAQLQRIRVSRNFLPRFSDPRRQAK